MRSLPAPIFQREAVPPYFAFAFRHNKHATGSANRDAERINVDPSRCRDYILRVKFFPPFCCC
jgi:hypothetical protein